MANSQSSTFVTVTHGEETIKVGSNIFDLIPTDLQTSVKSSKYAVVLDENVNRLYGERFREAFTKANVPLLVKVIAPGESSKCRRVKEDIEDFLISNGFNRDSCIIALGGGVIGDLAGFVASTYMRGIPFVQIPTTLLAMVDSSIGGKTAIDTDAAKNIIGAFHHPKVIYLDVSFLKTLPQREFCNGMAEVIKTAAIRDSKLFELLENNTDRILERDTDLLQKMILATASIKLEVVAIDPHEKGVRCILNFGHTIGHAIEALVTPELLHGECVSIGMILETKLAHQMGHLKHPSTVGRLLRCVQSYKLPIHIPKYLQVEKVIHKMTLDKKNANSKIRCVILKGIADVFETPVVVEPHVITQVLSPYISVVPGKVSGEISVPGSKSISNRVLPICGLGQGTCRVKGLLNADDTRVMLDSLLELGVGLAWEDDGQTLVVTPSGKLTSPSKALFLGNAGTASRFLTTMCTIIEGRKATLTGTKRLTERPIKHLTTALLNNGCKIKFLDKEGFFPLEIEGTGFPGGTIELNANVSSQYVSSILLSAPYAKQPVTLHLQDKAVSRPFIDMTLQVMAQFGIQVEQKDADTYFVPQGIYKNPAEFVIESDASSASYPLAMAAITGGTVTVHNIGKNSIQGDAKFYTVLQMMGCEASQTVTSTTVTGPVGKPLKAVDVDMGDMTDTFMTVCALAAVADGVTRITNIANQRVKECNRIAAMVTELTKCGVQASELEDGLEIVGCAGDYSKLHGAHIECYLDHRIAMSFAVLGCVVPGIVITDKECTDKTYPEFWYDVEKNFNLKLKSVVPQQEKQEKLRDAMYLSNKGVIIVGMRGSGKTSNARALANALSRPLVDLDEAFQVENKVTIQQFVDVHGWPEFRKKEEELFKKIVAENVNKGTIISTGGGLVESSTAREALRNAFSSYIVVQLHRDINDIVEYLSADKTRANLGEEVMSIWNRRCPLYKESSQFEFCMEKGEKNWKTVENNFISFVKKILQRDFGDTLSPSDSSFFLCLSYPDLREVSPEIIHKLASSVDAFELRVDLLRDTSADSIKSQIAYLRSHTVLPIIFTVRSQSQGGSFNGTEEQYFELLSLGARVHCEFIDVEVIWSTNGKSKFLSELKDRSIVIVSYHNYQERITPEKLKNWVSLCKNHDIRDPIIKIVAFAHSFEDNFLVHDLKVNSPYIAICAGEKGKLSRVLNNFLTPVTHELLPVKAAPGQLSAQEILRLRSELSISPASVSQQNYYLFGSPISRSRSPLMHNTGFAHYSLPHVYQLCETESIDVVAKQLNDKSTFGGSVTIPHKQTVLPYMTCLSDSAKAIGAVNTVKKLVDGSFYGDNTDWLAIYKLVKHKLGAQTRAKGLVVGAGGTAHAACYALNQLQIPFFIYNRTGEKAQKLAQEFGGTAITDLKDITDSVQVVVSTVPSSAEFQVPQHLAHKDLLVVELSYYPRFTKMLQQATENGFKYVEGIELLLEQGLAQFEIWTKKKAPRKEIVEAFLKSNDGELAANPPNFVNDDSVFQ